MDAGAKGWLLKTIRANFWRVATYYDFEDLVQEGYWIYYKIVARYTEVKTKSQLMALFKVSFINHLHTLANKRTQAGEILLCDILYEETETWFLEKITPPQPDASLFNHLLLNAPEPVKKVLLLFSSESSLKKLRREYKINRRGHRETFNERLCKLTGQDPKAVDLPEMIKGYFNLST